MKLGIGTAQFGFSYGITNRNGQVSSSEVSAIIRQTHQVGIDLLDTASVYGNSEAVLGACLAENEHHSKFRIVTKTLPLKSTMVGSMELERIRQGLAASLHNLRKTEIDSVLVHHAEDLLVPGGDGLYELLVEWKSKNKIKKIGVSIYRPSQIEALLARYRLDVIQIPLNVFDQRLLTRGLLKEMKRSGVEIHVRSIFLQGALLSDPAQLPAVLGPLRPMLERLDTVAQKYHLSRLEMALGFIHMIAEVDYGIVGVASLDQFESICQAYARLDAQSTIHQVEFADFSIDDTRLVNPALWS